MITTVTAHPHPRSPLPQLTLPWDPPTYRWCRTRASLSYTYTLHRGAPGPGDTPGLQSHQLGAYAPRRPSASISHPPRN